MVCNVPQIVFPSEPLPFSPALQPCPFPELSRGPTPVLCSSDEEF